MGQQVTGQQRYANEIARRLVVLPGVRLLVPPHRLLDSALGAWAWSQSLGIAGKRGDGLLSLTSRAPAVRRRHVLVVHDIFVLSNPEWYSKRYVFTHAPLLRHQVLSAAAIVAVSPQTAEAVGQVFGYRRPVLVAPNAATRSEVDPLSLKGSPLVERLAGCRFLLSVGSMDPRKNFGRLAAAYFRLPASLRTQMPLVVVGGFNPRVFAGDPVEWPAEVVALNYVSDQELDWLYRNASAVVVPSLAEGFGLPVVESMMAGTPVALSDIAIFRWIAGDDALYFSPTSVASMTHALRTLVTHPPPRVRADTVQSLQARFNWTASAYQIYSLAQEVIH